MTADKLDILFKATSAGDYDDEAAWAAVGELRTNGSAEIFERAAAWCISPDPLKRARGADILCQLRSPRTHEEEKDKKMADPIFVQESYAILSRMIASETDPQALASALYGLGHLGVEGSSTAIAPFAEHANENVRHAVTFGLGSFHNEPPAIQALLKLIDDVDEDVRDYAVFGLGNLGDADSQEIREAFARRLDDPASNVREEAIAALAKRRDLRAVVPMFNLMQSGSYYVHLEDSFEVLLDPEYEPGGWSAEDFIDALYYKFPDLLPPRIEISSAEVETTDSASTVQALSNFASTSGLELNAICQVVISGNPIEHSRSSAQKLSSPESDKLSQLVRVFDHASTALGGAEQACRWMNTPKQRFSQHTPLEMLRTSSDSSSVEQMLGQIDKGMFA